MKTRNVYRANNDVVVGDGLEDKVIAFKRKRCGFESSHRWSNSPLSCALFATELFRKNNTLGYLGYKRSTI